MIVTHDYGAINHSEMTDNFIIRPEKVKRVWDITEGRIGISFVPSYDKYDYEIEFEEDKTLLAKDVLDMITNDDTEAKIIGRIKIR
jgi:hypothetical protein